MKPLTPRQQRILAAIDAGHRSYRAIARAAHISTISVVQYELVRLAQQEQIILEDGSRGLEVYDARSFQEAWDAAARLAGNPVA